MSLKDVMSQLESLGDPNTKKILLKHGAQEPFFGVKVADLKKVLKTYKKNHDLAIELYNTGNSDAMYLAGLMADEKQVDEELLDDWVKKAYWYYISEYTVPWLAADAGLGKEMGLKWIDSDIETTASAGWAALGNWLIITPNEEIDVALVRELMQRVEQQIHTAQNRVRYTMNNFIICAGGYIPELTEESKKMGNQIGKVSVEMGGTACKVPVISDYIEKMEDKDRIGKKKKKARC